MPIENNNLETVKREHTKEDISLKKELETWQCVDKERNSGTCQQLNIPWFLVLGFPAAGWRYFQQLVRGQRLISQCWPGSYQGLDLFINILRVLRPNLTDASKKDKTYPTWSVERPISRVTKWKTRRRPKNESRQIMKTNNEPTWRCRHNPFIGALRKIAIKMEKEIISKPTAIPWQHNVLWDFISNTKYFLCPKNLWK